MGRSNFVRYGKLPEQPRHDKQSENFMDRMLSKVAEAKTHVGDVQADAAIVVADGSTNQATKMLSDLGCNGKHKGNIARDFRRRVVQPRRGMFPPVFTANLPFAKPEGIGVEWRDHDIFLPHSYMSWLYEFPDEFADRLHC